MKKVIEVNTTYARIALILLAMNFALTTYAIINIADSDDQSASALTPQEEPANPVQAPSN